MSERKIGVVIAVDSFRVFIKLDSDLKSLYKSGYEDIYEVARINSYIIIPIGADRIVAIITRVKAIDETELSSDKEAIFLTESARYLVATMIGTLENSGTYIQGVYNYPVLDNHVWYITKEDLDKIFDQKEVDKISYSEDYFLPIGTSPAFSDYKIKINPDKFFGKHAAILGNTGSGKSCTVASIIQSIFNYNYGGKEPKTANFIIFDTNGEYKKAFMGFVKKQVDNVQENEVEIQYKKRDLVNPFYIDQSGMRVPFWFMNYDDIDYLFEPSHSTKTPILKRAISLAKNEMQANKVNVIPNTYLSWIESVLIRCADIQNFWKLRNAQITSNVNHLRNLQLSGFDQTELINQLIIINGLLPAAGSYNDPNIALLNLAVVKIKEELERYYELSNASKVKEEKNIDLPTWFGFEEMVTKYIEQAINEQENSSNRIREFVSTLRLRMQSYFNDERMATPLLLTQDKTIEKALAKFLSFILGDICKIYAEDDIDLFSKYYKDQSEKKGLEKIDKGRPSQLTIIDMSLLPFEVLETITGLVGRLILEFVTRFESEKRGSFPIVLVLEEAQNYIPEKNKGDRVSISKKVFERIAREGRKYGISLLVSSQRPSELSKTVLSQCNSFIIHRLQNPEDQKYIRQLVSAANEDILQQLPILPQQHAIIMGDAVRTPTQVKINNANPKPNSDNPTFIQNWLNDIDKGFPDYIGIASSWEKGEKTKPKDNPNNG